MLKNPFEILASGVLTAILCFFLEPDQAPAVSLSFFTALAALASMATGAIKSAIEGGDAGDIARSGTMGIVDPKGWKNNPAGTAAGAASKIAGAFSGGMGSGGGESAAGAASEGASTGVAGAGGEMAKNFTPEVQPGISLAPQASEMSPPPNQFSPQAPDAGTPPNQFSAPPAAAPPPGPGAPQASPPGPGGPGPGTDQKNRNLGFKDYMDIAGAVGSFGSNLYDQLRSHDTWQPGGYTRGNYQNMWNRR